MTDTWVGSLWFVGDDDLACEILNDNRTRHYQSAHPLWTGTICDECQCEWLDYNPCLAGGAGALLTYGDTPGDEDNPAPWFDEPVSGPSSEFLGWMVNTIDGLDYSHYSRSVNQRANDGANVTPMRAGGREITYTVIGTALSERGMVYGLHWLAAMLLGIGGRCGYGKAVLRTHCDSEDITGGLYELRQIACLQPPEWTENFLNDHGCLVREARFTIIALDPCLYSCRTSCGVATGALADTPFSAVCDGATPSELLCGPMPIWVNPDNAITCCAIEAGAAIDSRAATIQIDATARAGPFAIEFYSAIPGTPCDDVVGEDDFYIGRVAIVALEAGQGALVDCATRTVFFRNGANSPWEADDSLILFNGSEYPCFPRLSGCDTMYVAIRPATACPAQGVFTVQIESVAVTSCTTC